MNRTAFLGLRMEPHRLTNREARTNPAPSHLARDLQDLHGQVVQARFVLSQLQRKIAGARRQVDVAESAQLVEVNEQLIVSALRRQSDAEQAAQALEALSRSCVLDALTQLPNRVPLQERFLHAMASAQRSGKRMAVLFIDINSFKGINDTLGHAASDDVLQHTAHCIAHAVRDVDFVCRYGGDEFVVLVTEVAQTSDAALVAQKIAAAAAVPFTLANLTMPMAVSLSIGMAIYPEDGADAEALLRCADEDIYRAKRLRAAPRGSGPGPVLA